MLVVVDQHPADSGEADDDGYRNRPCADADVAGGLPLGFVLRDLAISCLGIPVRVVHPPALRCAVGSANLPAVPDKTHPHSRGLVGGLTRQPLGAGPGLKALVVFGGVGAPDVAMRAPAVFVLGSSEFTAAAQLRPAGEAAGIVRAFAITHRGEN